MRPSRAFAPLSVFLSLFAFAVCQACRRHAAYEVEAPCGRCWSNLLKDLSEETRKGCFGHLRWQLGSFFLSGRTTDTFAQQPPTRTLLLSTQPFTPWLCTGVTFSTWWLLFCFGRRKRRSSLSFKPASTLVLGSPRCWITWTTLSASLKDARAPGRRAAVRSRFSSAPDAEPAGQCGEACRKVHSCVVLVLPWQACVLFAPGQVAHIVDVVNLPEAKVKVCILMVGKEFRFRSACRL